MINIVLSGKGYFYDFTKELDNSLPIIYHIDLVHYYIEVLCLILYNPDLPK